MMLSRMLIIITILQCSSFVWGGNFYDEDPHLMELTPRNFDKIIYRTNYTTLVEFYAPWCGYCQRLKPIMHKVAKKLDGIMPVASVNCDSPKNKQLCAENGIEGFPTLMLFRPPKVDMSKPYDQRTKFRKHAGMRYDSERKVAPIVDFSLSRLNNYVKRLLNLEKLADVFDKSTRPSIVLFSKNDKSSPAYKSIALDWLGILNCFIVPNSRLTSLSSIEKLKDTYPRIHGFLQDMADDQKTSEKSKLVLFDPHNDQYYVYSGNSLRKPQIAKFLRESLSLDPQEGPGSSRQSFVNGVLNNKRKKVAHDEL